MTDDVFHLHEPDYELSPYTGMTCKHWIECGKYILSRAFSHLKKSEDLLIFPFITIEIPRY